MDLHHGAIQTGIEAMKKQYEKGVNTYVDGSHGGGRTATGSGPVTWNHDGSPAGNC